MTQVRVLIPLLVVTSWLCCISPIGSNSNDLQVLAGRTGTMALMMVVEAAEMH